MKSLSLQTRLVILGLMPAALATAQQPALPAGPAAPAPPAAISVNRLPAEASSGQLVIGAVPEAPPSPGVTFFARPESGPGRSLIIRTSDRDSKADAALQEDLAVMCHILDKAIRSGTQGAQRHVMGIDVFFAPGAGARNWYLEGYGAVFVMQVGFPLLPTEAKREANKEQTEVDSSWEEARQEVYGRRDPTARMVGTPTEEYKEEKVTALKEAVLEALKNASNIRELKPEESITVCVLGGGAPSQAMALVPRGADSVNAVRRQRQVLNQGSALTIQVAKATADEFAKGKVNLEEVKKRARIATYAIPLAPAATTGGTGFGEYGGGFGGSSSGSTGYGGGSTRW